MPSHVAPHSQVLSIQLPCGRAHQGENTATAIVSSAMMYLLRQVRSLIRECMNENNDKNGKMKRLIQQRRHPKITAIVVGAGRWPALLELCDW